MRRPVSFRVAFHALDGSRQDLEVRGLMARAVLHEYDHLSAILLVRLQ